MKAEEARLFNGAKYIQFIVRELMEQRREEENSWFGLKLNIRFCSHINKHGLRRTRKLLH
jgi:hypothetical protein